MTISSSLNAGVMGLAANANRLGTISDNIANSGTFGYKRVEADFHSMVTSGNGGNYSAGGVRSTSQRLIDERGPLVTTNNSTDLAVRGRGMLPVTAESSLQIANGDFPMQLTTTGSFRTDAEGYLKTDSGLVLMGWPADADGTIPNFPRDTAAGLQPIKINANEFAAQPTTKIDLGLNLPATATNAGESGATEYLNIEYFENLGKSETLDIEFVPTIPATGTSNEWNMIIRDSATPGTVIGEYTLTFNDNRTSGGTLASVTAITGGGYDPATGEIVVDVAGGPMAIDIGLLDDSSGINQLSDVFAPVAISKDGSPIGNMIALDIDANGLVTAQYDVGLSRVLYQVPLADLPNPNGLVALDSQTYGTSATSGAFFLWDAGAGPTGSIVNFAREESSVDVATELTDLITTQRAYSSNAKVIQTVDEMLQETTNIKR